MTGPMAQAQRAGALPSWPVVETLETLTDYYTAYHQPGGKDPRAMAQAVLDSRYGGSNYVGLARDAQGRNVSSTGQLVDDFGRPLDGSGSTTQYSNGALVSQSIGPTADELAANSAAAIAERARLVRVAAAADAERERLERERADAIALANKVNSTMSGTAPATPPRVFTISDKRDNPFVALNANRPMEDPRTMTGDHALTLDQGGSYNPPVQILPTSNTTAIGAASWQKYAPYIIGAAVLVLLFVAMKKKGGAAS